MSKMNEKNQTLYFYGKDLLKKNKNASGSAPIRSVQICKNIQKRFKFINCKMTLDIEDKKNSAFLFVKDNFDLTLDTLKKVKNNNNIIIFDILDYYDNETHDVPDMEKNHFIEYIDILIVNNYFMRKKYYTLNKPIYVIPHHYDERLIQFQNPPKCEKLQFIYNGELGATHQNCLYIDELKKKYNIIHCSSFNEYIQNHNKKNYCYISIRKEDTYEYNNRPLMKLAHAAGTDSNIIITKDKSVMDFLDPSYPYLLKNSNYETVLKMMDYVKKTFNNDVWKKASSMMNELKMRLSINHIVSYDYMKILRYIDKPMKPKTKYKICFCTSYFGAIEYFELSNNFTKVDDAEYFCFTNLKKEQLGSQDWNIVEIQNSMFPDLKQNNVKISRYFKFMVWKYLKEKMNKEYDFIFYCDHYLNPSCDVNWLKICDRLNNSQLGFLQYEHKRFKDGIEKDIQCIIANNTEDETSLNDAKQYLKKIDSKISLKTPQYFENTVFGMQVNMKKVRKITHLFWQHYSKKYPSYRDQPLWNFLYLFKDHYPYIDNELRSYFNGYKTIWRNKENY
jgi:hypothetical protein